MLIDVHAALACKYDCLADINGSSEVDGAFVEELRKMTSSKRLEKLREREN